MFLAAGQRIHTNSLISGSNEVEEAIESILWNPSATLCNETVYDGCELARVASVHRPDHSLCSDPP